MSSIATLLLSVAFTASHSPAQDANPIVSATVKAAPAPRAIEELSKQIGVPLTAMPSVKNDILIIRVEKVPLKDLMDKIASTIHAGWQKDESGYRLIRDDAMRQDERAKDAAAEAENFRRGIADQQKKLADQGTFDAKRAEYLAERLKNFHDRIDPESSDWGNEWRQTQEITEQSPANRATLRICAMLKAEDLAALPFDKKVVFSDKPTRMQRPMPGNIMPIIQQFKKEAMLMSDAAKRKLGDREMNCRFGDDSLYGQVTGTPTKCLLSLVRYGAWGGVQVTFQIANEKGRWMGNGNAMIGRTYGEEAQQEMQQILKDSSKEEPAKLSPGSELMRTLFVSNMNSDGKKLDAPSGEVRQQFLRPDLYDPLSFIATDVLLNMAQVKHLNMVANLNDVQSFSLGYSPEISRPSVLLKGLLQSQSGGQLKDGWLTVSPPNQSYNRDRQIDRVSMAQCIALAEKKGKLTLDDAAVFALKNENNMSAQILGIWQSLLAGRRMQEANWDWETLRFYGSLSASQWQTIGAKKPISLRTLTPVQQKLVHAMVFDKQWSNLQMNPPEDAESPEGMDWDAFYNGLQHEPTESLPDGIPYDGTLTVTTDKNEVAFLGDVAGNPQWMTGRAYTAGELAWEMFSRERKDLFPWQNTPGQGETKFDSFRFGDRLMVNLQFKFTRTLGLGQNLQENSYGNGGEVPFNGLPAVFRKQIEEQMAMYREQYKNVKPGDLGDGGGGTKQNIPPR